MKRGSDDLLAELTAGTFIDVLLLKKLRTVGFSFYDCLLRGDNSTDGSGSESLCSLLDDFWLNYTDIFDIMCYA